MNLPVWLLSVKQLNGHVLQLDVTDEVNEDTSLVCVDTVKHKLVDALNTVGLAPHELYLFYDDGDNENGTHIGHDIDPSRSLVLLIDSPVVEFIQRFSVDVTENAITIDLTQLTSCDADIVVAMNALRELLCRFSPCEFRVHCDSNVIVEWIANHSMMTDHCEMGGSYILGDFYFFIHAPPLSRADQTVTRDQLKQLFFSLPPNHNRSSIHFEVDAGMFSDTTYLTNDFLEEVYG